MALPDYAPPGPRPDFAPPSPSPEGRGSSFGSVDDVAAWFDAVIPTGGVYVPRVGCLIERDGRMYLRSDGTAFELGDDLWLLDSSEAPVMDMANAGQFSRCLLPAPSGGGSPDAGGAGMNWTPIIILALLYWWSRGGN